MVLESSFKKRAVEGAVRGKSKWEGMSETRMEKDSGILGLFLSHGWKTSIFIRTT